jgi:hypothetical protein
MYLAGRLLHRSAQSECERDAAEFIQGRFKEHTPDVSLEAFHSIESYPRLFASYMSEFLVVGFLALFMPLIAFLYGGAVFVSYLVEFSGYRGFSRFLPQFPSQNVVARFLGTKPKSLIVVTAYYDSGCASPLSAPSVVPWLRTIQNVLLAAMVVVLATCVADFISTRGGEINEFSVGIRWIAIATLLTGALGLYMSSTQSEDIRGANGNASGVAGLLGLAKVLAESPPEEADVWLVATGSHESWMGGMRQLLEEHKLDGENTFILNLEGIGAGELHYLTREGMLQALSSDTEMLAVADELGATHKVKPGVMRAVPTEAHIPLTREMKAMTIMGLDKDGLPPHWNQISDRVTEVEEKAISSVIEFSDAFVRRLAKKHAGSASPPV